MPNRLVLLFVASAFLFLASCAGSKGGSGSSSYGDDDGEAPVPKANELKEARNEAVNLTEENHKLAREIFELKNKLGLPTDE